MPDPTPPPPRPPFLPRFLRLPRPFAHRWRFGVSRADESPIGHQSTSEPTTTDQSVPGGAGLAGVSDRGTASGTRRRVVGVAGAGCAVVSLALQAVTAAMGESAAVPGLGPARIKEILRHFGSVAAVRRADASQLAEVKGVGPAMAQRIVERLAERTG